MDKLIWIIVALIAGAILPLQAGLNSKLARTIDNPVYASLISFIIGTLSMTIYVIGTRQTIVLSNLKNVSWYTWIGGVLGAFYVTTIVYLFPKLGPGLTFGLIVAGQMGLTIYLEHFNVLVSNPHPINFMRLFGMLLIVIGVIIVQKF